MLAVSLDPSPHHEPPGDTEKLDPKHRLLHAVDPCLPHTPGLRSPRTQKSIALYSPPSHFLPSRPKIPLTIYEFQGCPFCAKVREAVSILDLDVLFLPCPRGP